MQTAILTQMFLTKAENAIVHLTANTSAKAGRFNIIAAKPYQGNRKSKAKPPLLEACRQALAQRENWLPEFEVVLHHQLEADDGMMMDAYRLKEHGIIWSDDKDLRMTPYNYWCQDTQTVQTGYGFGKLWTKELSSTTKCLGVGKKFFWAQMLMGDTADNIAGVAKVDGKLCGPVGAFNLLHGIDEESACANFVLDCYRAIDQNPLPEGWLLWLLRWDGDTFWQYLHELELTPANKKFIYDCANRQWFKQPEPQHEEFEDAPF
jgi:5'-3' exonuclease